jgi:predicted kinase
MRTHYPRTPHLPWSPGKAADDVTAGDLSGFAGREVVVTEKLDGENTTMYTDGLHARSLDSAHHPSRAWVKALHGRIAGLIPAGWRICGENMFARHSVAYDDLASYFYAFSVWSGDDCLSWNRTVRFARRIGVPVPEVLWRGVFDERALRALRLDTTRQEGFVVRTAEGFARNEFGVRVAKWVRPSHVQTGTHWMMAAVVPNGLGPRAALWDVRSGATPDAVALAAAVGLPESAAEPEGTAGRKSTAVVEVSARLDVVGRTGDARLAGVLATLLHDHRRSELAAHLAAHSGMPLARRVADLVGLHTNLHRAIPDDQRRAGLVRMAMAADLGVLHAVAATVAPGTQAREQVEWSSLHADDAGLLGPAPLEPLRTGMREALDGVDPDAADRCWAEARDAFAAGRIATPEEGKAFTWRWRAGDFPRVVLTCGPSGSGKSTFIGTLGLETGAVDVVSLDDLRAVRGNRADQRDNTAIVHSALDKLDAALGAGRSVVWDATSINGQQRAVVHAVAKRRGAWLTHAVLLVQGAELVRRNAVRYHPVPPHVLDGQLHKFAPPYPGEAHRTWYVGAYGAVDDVAGALGSEDP